MRIIVAGSRSIKSLDLVSYVIQTALTANQLPLENIQSIVCGDASGVDSLGAEWAKYRGIPVDHYPANWKLHGKSAGSIRNHLMAKNADMLVAIWDGQSTGTADMILEAHRGGLLVYVHSTFGAFVGGAITASAAYAGRVRQST